MPVAEDTQRVLHLSDLGCTVEGRAEHPLPKVSGWTPRDTGSIKIAILARKAPALTNGVSSPVASSSSEAKRL